MPGTAVFVTVRRAERGRLFFVRVERRQATTAAATVVVVQPRLETRFVAAAARLLGPKVEVLLVEIAVIVPDDDHVIRLEEHVQTFVELHVPLAPAGLGGLGGVAAGRRTFQRRFFGPWLATVAQLSLLLLLLFVRGGSGRRWRFVLLLFLLHVGDDGDVRWSNDRHHCGVVHTRRPAAIAAVQFGSATVPSAVPERLDSGPPQRDPDCNASDFPCIQRRATIDGGERDESRRHGSGIYSYVIVHENLEGTSYIDPRATFTVTIIIRVRLFSSYILQMFVKTL